MILSLLSNPNRTKLGKTVLQQNNVIHCLSKTINRKQWRELSFKYNWFKEIKLKNNVDYKKFNLKRVFFF